MVRQVPWRLSLCSSHAPNPLDAGRATGALTYPDRASHPGVDGVTLGLMNPDTEQIHALAQAWTDAMIAADTAALDELMLSSYSLTHITGYLQPKAEWFSQIRSGRMNYHAATDRGMTITLDEDQRGTYVLDQDLDATIYGSRRVWPLRFVTEIVCRDGQWLLAATVASTRSL